jgi:hypothetical protein
MAEMYGPSFEKNGFIFIEMLPQMLRKRQFTQLFMNMGSGVEWFINVPGTI